MYNGINHPLLNAAYDAWMGELNALEQQYNEELDSLNGTNLTLGHFTEDGGPLLQFLREGAALQKKREEIFSEHLYNKRKAAENYLKKVDEVLVIISSETVAA